MRPGAWHAARVRRWVENLTPAWFAAVMGTGIVAVVGARLTLPGVRVLSVVAGVLAAGLLVGLLLGSALRWWWFPGRAAREVGDTGVRPFAGAPPIAALTVSAVVGALAPGWTPAQASLWVLGTAAAVVTAAVVPLSLLGSEAPARPSWLLSAAPPLVAAATGADLVAKAPAGQARLLLLGLCVAMSGAALLLALVLTTLVVGQANREGAPSGDDEPPVWVVLGTLAQAVVAALLLSEQGDAVLPGRGLAGSGLVLGTALWGAAALVLVTVLALTVREVRSGLGFGLSWWSFTFPLGSAVLATVVLGTRVTSPAVLVLADVLFGVQLLVWLGVAGATVRAVVRGDLLRPARASSTRR